MKELFVLFTLLTFAQQKACTQEYNTISRDSFSLQYPAKWKIDLKDKDYNPDTSFGIKAPGKLSNVTFYIRYKSADIKKMVEFMLSSITPKPMKNAEVFPIFEWGKLKGEGRIVTGKFSGQKTIIRFFIFSDCCKSMLVTEFYSDNSVEELKKDFDFIASSFAFKE